MKKRKLRKIICLGVTGLFFWNHGPVGFAEESLSNNEQEIKSEKNDDGTSYSAGEKPVKITADYVEYNQKNGDFSANGRVHIEQTGASLRSSVIVGNSESGKVEFPEEVRYFNDRSLLQLEEGWYNYLQEEGEFLHGIGQLNRRYFKGEKIHIAEEKITVEDVRMAKDIALLEEDKNPSLWIRSRQMVIIPNKKMTVYSPKLYIGPHKILSLPTYSTSLDPNKKNQAPFPKISYKDDLGMYIEYTHPLVLPYGIEMDTTVGYYYRADFKYNVQFHRNTDIGRFNLTYGQIFNSSENVWVKKRPELTYRTPNIDIGNSGFYLYGFGLAGNWKEGRKSSPRYEAEGWIMKRPIPLGPQTRLSFGGGIRYIYEEDFDNDFSQLRGFMLLEHQFNADLYGSISIEGNSKNKSYFKYRSTDVENGIRPFITYKIDQRNQAQAGAMYDIDAGKWKKFRLGWFYDLRGFQLSVEFTRDQIEKNNDFSIKVHTNMF